MNFDIGLNIDPQTDPLGFKYGADVFGPKVENRFLNDIRLSLMDQDCSGPEIVYSIVMGIGKKKHYEVLKKQHLLFGAVTYSAGRLGDEPIRSQGHIHKKSVYGKNWSTPEVYQIWSGKAIIYMQEFAEDNPGVCFAVYGNPGDIIIVPPSWAHATISADPSVPLTFGAWCDQDYGFEYESVRNHNGLAWYPLLNDKGELTWFENKNYSRSDLIEKSPNIYNDLGIVQGISIYSQYEKNPSLFSFVPKPYLIAGYWKNFTP